MPLLYQKYKVTKNPFFNMGAYIATTDVLLWGFSTNYNVKKSEKFNIIDLLKRRIFYKHGPARIRNALRWTLFIIYKPIILLILFFSFFMKKNKIQILFCLTTLIFITITLFLDILTIQYSYRHQAALFPLIVISLGFIFIYYCKNNYGKKIIQIMLLSLTIIAILNYYIILKNNYKINKTKLNYYNQIKNVKQIKEINKTSLIASNIAPTIAYFLNLKSIWLPIDVESIKKINNKNEIDYIIFSSTYKWDYRGKKLYYQYKDLYNKKKKFNNYTFFKEFNYNSSKIYIYEKIK
jgi:hypothetical protein